MSTQGGTLQRRGTIELPIWPVAVLVVAAVAAAIGMTLLRDTGQVRDQGAVATTLGRTHSGAAIRNRDFAIPAIVGISHVAPSLHSQGYAGFENPAASGAVAWGSIGGPNEALHRQYSPPQDGVALTPTWGPIVVNGEPCMQCK